MRSLAPILLACSLACACAGHAPTPPARVRLLELEASSGRGESSAPVLLARRRPGDGGAWSLTAERHKQKVVEDAEGGTGLFLYGNEERSFAVDGPFEARAFNQVAVVLSGQYRATLRVRLLSAGQPAVESAPLPIFVRSERQTIVARFVENRERATAFDRIEVVLAAGAGPVCIHALELTLVPLEDWVADRPREGWIALQGDARRAVLLERSGGLSCRLDPEPDDELVLACALEPELRLPGQRPRVELTLAEPGRGPQRLEVALEADPSLPLAWHSLRLPLGRRPRNGLELRLRLLAEGDEPAFAWVGEAALVQRAPAPPTVVLVTSDTHRADHLGALPDGAGVRTPALDALAARGVLFTHAFSAAETTVPSHSAILSGRHPRDTHIVNNYTRLSEDVTTLAEAFARAGYRTLATVSARHLADDISGLGQGFQRFSFPAGEEPADATVERALAWMLESEGEPVFLWLHLFDAHTPYAAPSEYEAPYLAEAELSGATPGWPLERERIRARYKGEIGWLDHQLARVLELPRVAAGLVAFTGDHGEAQGEAGVNFTHEELFASTLRVPLILAGDGLPPGRRVEQPVPNSDLAHTLLALAGIPAGEVPGRDLREQLGSDPPPPRPLFALSTAGQSASITLGDEHLILHLSEHAIGKPTAVRTARRHQVELYDLTHDHACEHDLALERPERARRLRQSLVEWLCATQAEARGQAVELSADQSEGLEAMGYSTNTTAPASTAWFDPECDCEECRRWQ